MLIGPLDDDDWLAGAELDCPLVLVLLALLLLPLLLLWDDVPDVAAGADPVPEPQA